MHINWNLFATLIIVATGIHWLLARSQVFSWFWRLHWVPKGFLRETFDSLLRCPACSGWWIGFGLGLGGHQPIRTGHPVVDVALAGLACLVGLPIGEALLVTALHYTHVA